MMERYLERPQKQRFWRVLVLFLGAAAALDPQWWDLPPKNIFMKLISNSIAVLSKMLVLSQCGYAFWNIHSLTSYQVYTIISMTSSSAYVNIRLWSASRDSYKRIMIKFMKDIHLFNHQGDEFSRSILIRSEKYIRWTTYSLTCLVSLSFVIWNILPLTYNIKNIDAVRNGTEKLVTCMYMVMPFDYERSIFYWIIMSCLNAYVLFCGNIAVCVYEAIFYAIIFNLIGHINIFRNKLVNFDYDGDQVRTREKIVHLIKYHSFILQTFKGAEDAFGLAVSSNYLINFGIDSTLLYMILTSKDFKTSSVNCVVFVIYMGGMVLLSMILEKVRRDSEGLLDAVYALKWERMSVSNQKLLIPLLMHARPTLTFVSAGGLQTGYRPMISVIKSTFSYYIMLKQFEK